MASRSAGRARMTRELVRRSAAITGGRVLDPARPAEAGLFDRTGLEAPHGLVITHRDRLAREILGFARG